MRQLLFPVLCLVTVALSKSAVLPLMSVNQESDLGIDGQQNDNIFSNKYKFRNVLKNIYYYKIPDGKILSNGLSRKMTKYVNTNNDRAEENLNSLVDGNYDGEGFRKEQWHNYPRQLDRLHTFLQKQTNPQRRSQHPDNAEDNDLPDNVDSNNNIANEFFIDNSEDENEKYNAMLAANPLLVFKIHLECLRNGNKLDELSEDENLFSSNISPALKVKRDGSPSQDVEIIGESIPDSKTVSKRLFSMWSRLQSLSPKGHELQHRRHHAFYSFPDADGSGSLTAETRTAMKRPPGSPLRWG